MTAATHDCLDARPIFAPQFATGPAFVPGAHKRWSGVERRQETRYATSDEAKVALIDFPGVRVSATIRDVSRSGIRVELPIPAGSGSRLQIFIGNRTVVVAVACYCRPSGATYQVGAKIESVYDSTHRSNLTCASRRAAALAVERVAPRVLSRRSMPCNRRPARCKSFQNRLSAVRRLNELVISSIETPKR